MSKITVVAKVVAKKAAVAAVKTELLKLIVPTRNENGCIEYRLHQDNQDSAVFFFYETWEDAGTLEKHINTDHYKAYVRAVSEMIEEKVVNKLTMIG